MTNYVHWNDVVSRYANEVAKISGGAEEVRNSYIDGAEALINATLAQRYSVPFSPVPPLIRDLAIDLAYLKIVRRQDEKTTKVLREETRSILSGLACGSLTLVVSGQLVNQLSVDVAWSTHQNYGSAFGTDDPVNWLVDETWVEYFEDQR